MGTMSFQAEPVTHVVQLIKEHYKGGPILDYGCGTGRYTECFPASQYTGVDGYPENIEYCKERWPDRKWILADLETYLPRKKFNYLFSSVTMEQLDNLPMNWAYNYLLIEPLGFKHDYLKIYKPQTVIGINGAEEVLKFMVAK